MAIPQVPAVAQQAELEVSDMRIDDEPNGIRALSYAMEQSDLNAEASVAEALCLIPAEGERTDA